MPPGSSTRNGSSTATGGAPVRVARVPQHDSAAPPAHSAQHDVALQDTSTTAASPGTRIGPPFALVPRPSAPVLPAPQHHTLALRADGTSSSAHAE